MEKVSSDENKRHSSRWIMALTSLVLIQTLGFVGVSVITYFDVSDLDQKATSLRQDIKQLEDTFLSLDDDTDGMSEDHSHEERHTALDRIRRHVTSRLVTRQSSLLVEMIKIQEKIIEKHCQDRNKTCPPGPRGVKGHIGQQGSAGTQGSPGYNGQPGQQGPTGYLGSRGTVGETGLRGDPGVAVGMGLVGMNGTRGEGGVKGPKGESGIHGLKGFPGSKGDRGELGLPGSLGINGSQGQQGDSGIPGMKGLRGEPGVQGTKGNDSRKFADGCECLTKPSFNVPSDSTVHRSLHSIQELPCNATGNPEPTITVIREATRKRSVLSAGKGLLSRGSGVLVSSADYGKYSCEAKNKFGSVRKYVNIIPHSC